MRKYDEPLVNLCMTIPKRQHEFLKSVKVYLRINSSELIRTMLDDLITDTDSPIIQSLEAKRRTALHTKFIKK